MGEKKEEEVRIAEEILESFGFGGLVNLFKNSDVFRERMEEVNRHIRENLDAEGNRRSHVDFDFSVSTLDDHFSTRKASSRRRPSSRGREWEPSRKPGGKGKSKKKRAKELREPLVDLFDDEEKMRVIAIFPEVEEEEELGIELTDRVLVLKTDENREEVQLQDHPAGQPEVKFKNGIFEIVLHKNKD